MLSDRLASSAMNPRADAIAAVDLGASSGRVMLGRVGPDTLELTEVSRFANDPVRVAGTLHWDILGMYRGVLDGLRRAGPVASIGVDSWAVDYGLLDGDGQLLGNPVHYRDARTVGVMAKVHAQVPPEELYGLNGLQFQPFNTLYQLVAAQNSAQFAAARTVALIPDLITYWLTGHIGAERTNASTTGLLDVRTGAWATQLMRRLGIAPELFPAIREPGTPVGRLLADVADQIGGDAAVTAVGSHDTASAVAAVPATTDRFAYISCGTWSLVGLELGSAVLTDASREANFTNEVGLDGTVRYLRNVMGLWPIQECVRVWEASGLAVDLAELIDAAAGLPTLARAINVDQPLFLAPGDMPTRIGDECRRLGQPAPTTPADMVRCVLDSLALAHRAAIVDAQRLSGRAVDVVHIVGGGSRNALLCQLTADACGLPVVAGPDEATAIGNILVQARALGLVAPDRGELRALVRRTQAVRSYEPRPDHGEWAEAAARVGSFAA